ncbi:guanine nucleotide binding protein, alpha subunit [Lentinula boryana]|uniref:Guanine nucleotide binding protein, alpha subunit n=1 Tax=Lentinula boryana TaxID=40481 RepID=A0ABQ8QN29_9AGAR|nr:guanine nucleotide binding protein, alpha subunit [Lentinula boryana]
MYQVPRVSISYILSFEDTIVPSDRRYKFHIRHDFRRVTFPLLPSSTSFPSLSGYTGESAMIEEADPFIEFLRPPLNETPSERATRKIRESEEKHISDAIDEQIRQEKHMLQKQKELVKVLLLGQSESDFRLEYARGEWEAEKASWKAVVQLNLIRSITSILDAIQAEIDGEPLSTALELDDLDAPAQPRGSVDMLSIPDEVEPNPSTQSALSAEDIQKLQLYRLKLAPLRRVEMDLKLRLGVATEEVTSMDDMPETQSDPGTDTHSLESPDSRHMLRLRKSRRRRIQGEEIVVRGLRWTEFLTYGRTRSVSGKTRASFELQETAEGGATDVLAGCKEDMKILWMSGTVRNVLKKRKIEMENNAGFFLNDIDRIASLSYLPSDDDVVRSRLRTVGVQEYRIFVDTTNTLNLNARPKREWVLYDVGGSRTMRRAWIPYFQDVNAIIFPISCFDEVLLEDPSVNRLNDSVALWKAITTSRLLQNTTMVCFLNKCDILKRKLRSGIQFRNFVREYGNQPNDITPIVKFIKDRFRNIAIKYSITQRTTYIYTTSVTLLKFHSTHTSTPLTLVRDSIFRENLASAKFV